MKYFILKIQCFMDKILSKLMNSKNQCLVATENEQEGIKSMELDQIPEFKRNKMMENFQVFYGTK